MDERASLARPPGSAAIPVAPAGARRTALQRLIAERGFISVADVAREIGISDMTVRRDLEVLERDGLIQRSHGGAVPAPPTTVIPAEPSYAARRDLNREAKQRIALAASALVMPDQAIGLDVGSTVACLAAELAGRATIEIVTNSLQTVLAAAGCARGRVLFVVASPATSFPAIGWIASSSASPALMRTASTTIRQRKRRSRLSSCIRQMP